jgi:hypothetical protein
VVLRSDGNVRVSFWWLCRCDRVWYLRPGVIGLKCRLNDVFFLTTSLGKKCVPQ